MVLPQAANRLHFQKLLIWLLPESWPESSTTPPYTDVTFAGLKEMIPDTYVLPRRPSPRPASTGHDRAGFVRTSPGSVLYRSGATTVLVTARFSDKVPPFLEGKGSAG